MTRIGQIILITSLPYSNFWVQRMLHSLTPPLVFVYEEQQSEVVLHDSEIDILRILDTSKASGPDVKNSRLLKKAVIVKDIIVSTFKVINVIFFLP